MSAVVTHIDHQGCSIARLQCWCQVKGSKSEFGASPKCCSQLDSLSLSYSHTETRKRFCLQFREKFLLRPSWKHLSSLAVFLASPPQLMKSSSLFPCPGDFPQYRVTRAKLPIPGTIVTGIAQIPLRVRQSYGAFIRSVPLRNLECRNAPKQRGESGRGAKK